MKTKRLTYTTSQWQKSANLGFSERKDHVKFQFTKISEKEYATQEFYTQTIFPFYTRDGRPVLRPGAAHGGESRVGPAGVLGQGGWWTQAAASRGPAVSPEPAAGSPQTRHHP